MTAITSTSTSHSGRASPATTMPVDTGNTPAQPPPDGAIDRLTEPRIGDVNRHLANVLEPRTGFVQQTVDIRHGLFGLRGRITYADVHRGVEILAHLAAHENGSAPRDDRLAQIIVELLLGIRVPGVELTDSSMHSRCPHMTRSDRSAERRTKSSGPSQSKL